MSRASEPASRLVAAIQILFLFVHLFKFRKVQLFVVLVPESNLGFVGGVDKARNFVCVRLTQRDVVKSLAVLFDLDLGLPPLVTVRLSLPVLVSVPSVHKAAAFGFEVHPLNPVHDEWNSVALDRTDGRDGERHRVEGLVQLGVVSVDVGVDEEVDVRGEEVVVHIFEEQRGSFVLLESRF